MHWQPAFDYCQAEGAYLAHMKSESEKTKLVEYVGKVMDPAVPYIWLGFNKTDENKWLWQPQGEELEYNSWYTNQPDNPDTEKCGALWTSLRGSPYTGKWNSARCDVNFRFVCMKLKETSE